MSSKNYLLKLAVLFPEVEDFHKDKSMARLNLEHLRSVTYTNQLPLKLFHINRQHQKVGQLIGI